MPTSFLTVKKEQILERSRSSPPIQATQAEIR